MAEESQAAQEYETDVLSELDYISRREIGRDAMWSLSSAKPGNGVDQLRDGSVETYWQSGKWMSWEVATTGAKNKTMLYLIEIILFPLC